MDERQAVYIGLEAALAVMVVILVAIVAKFLINLKDEYDHLPKERPQYNRRSTD